jgi:hypothetical protein
MECEATVELRMDSSTRINKRGFQHSVSFMSTMKALVRRRKALELQCSCLAIIAFIKDFVSSGS